MIISFELSQTINYPLAKTFAFLADYTNMPKWNYYIQSVEKISEGEIGSGSEFLQTRPHDVHRYKTVEYIPEQKVTVELQAPGPNHRATFKLSEENNQTKVIYRWDLDLNQYKALKFVPSFIKTPLFFITSRFILTKTKAAVADNFSKLKILLETGSVVLQDGRTSSIY